jgi:hypothetical protein
MFGIRNRLGIFVIGAACGVVIALTLGRVGDNVDQDSTPLAAQSEGTMGNVSHGTDVVAPATESTSQPTENQESPDLSQAFQYEREDSVSMPSVYLDMMGPAVEKVTIQDLHATFQNEPRHDAWAFEVESAIAQKIVDIGANEWAVVEHIECRAMTCEIAGYYTGDGRPRAPKVAQDIDRTIWWHDHIASQTYVSSTDEIDRFLTIVTAQRYPERTRSPKPLN